MTGRKAEEATRRSASALVGEHGWTVDVRVAPIEVGAFLTPDLLEGTGGYDLVVVPGLAKGDYSDAGAVKGTKSVSDLPLLDPGDFDDLSPRLPADRLLSRRPPGPEEGEPELLVGGLPVGGDTRMKVLAEVVDATEMDHDSLERRVTYFVENGADMVDLGIPRTATPEEVEDTASIAHGLTDAPLSVDTMEPGLIEAALPHVDLVLSTDGSVLESVGGEMADSGAATVVVPGDEGLEANLSRAGELGLDVLADPVLDPPLGGFVESLRRYESVETGAPLFFGAGNVTELIDADSVGVNGLLAAAAQEAGAAILFTPEHSVKARGSVAELSTAARMMYAADARGSPPKDLGLSLLVLKDKVDGDEPVEEAGEIVETRGRGYDRDPEGYFRIGLDREERRLVAVFHPSEGSDGEPLTLRGPDAATIYLEIADRGLVSLNSHAAYLGAELSKAEAALATGKSYRQDYPLFERPRD